MIYLAGICVFMVLFGCLGAYVAIQCGRPGLEGAVICLLLGPVGLFLVAILPRHTRDIAAPQRATNERAVSDFLGNLK